MRNSGRPRKAVDMDRARRMRAEGASPEIIAAVSEVSTTTLRARFRELDGTPVPGSTHVKALVSDERNADH